MNWIEKIKTLFSQKEKELPPLTNVSPTRSEDEACLAVALGKTNHPVYQPQPLMTLYSMHKAQQTLSCAIVNISQVEVIDLVNPLDGTFLGTAFAIKDDGGFYWIEIGARTMHFSKENAFFYKRAGSFRILMKEVDDNRIVAVCTYNRKKGEIIAKSLIEEDKTPPTDYDLEREIKCPVTPCPLHKVGEFVKTMTK